MDALAGGSFGKLTPVMTWDDGAPHFSVLDCFDQSLRRSGRLLLEIGGSFELLLDDGRVLSQSANRKGQFVPDLQDGPVKNALADVSPLRSLLPIGSGVLRRGTLALLDDDQKTHCRANLHVLTGARGEGAVLITLQGLRGYNKALAALRKQIEVCGGTALHHGGLYADIFPGQVAYNAKPEVIVKPDDTAYDAASDIIATYLPVARANEAGIIADHDTEFLHDYRIALRKIRSVLSLFKEVYQADQTADLKARFSDLMIPTGRLRDLDVYLLEKQRLYDLLPNTLHSGLDVMFRMFSAERKAAQAKLTDHLRSIRYETEIASLTKLFKKRKKLKSGPTASLAAQGYACTLIWKRYRKICKIGAGISSEMPDAEVHALRIHCKKLRYLMEFFGQLFPKPEFKSLLRPLKQLQDNLGLFNDYSVQQISLQDFLRNASDKPRDTNLAVAQSVGALTAVLHRRQLEERAKIVESFAQFNGPETQATFRDLFHDGRDKT